MFRHELYYLCLFPYSAAGAVEAKADNQSFLFTLVNPSGGEPTKITANPDASGGIRCKGDMGPSFGTLSYYDLQIWNKESCGRLNLSFGFIGPPNVNCSNYFTGENVFEINEMEVFKVNF